MTPGPTTANPNAPCELGEDSVSTVPAAATRCDVSRLEEEWITLLEAGGRYRVLRRVPPLAVVSADQSVGCARALLIDLETTGLDPEWDEPIELAMVRFAYERGTGEFLGAVESFAALHEPKVPIRPAITRITGLTLRDVAGCRIDPAAVARFCADAQLVIAFNAKFDRGFADAFWPAFERLPWACAYSGIDWNARGFEGGRLGHLLMQAGFFSREHRALDDVVATLHLLTHAPADGGEPPLAELLRTARKPTVRVWAEGAPYRLKDALRERGYRWSDGSRGLPRAWYRDIAMETAEVEAEYLRREVFDHDHPGPRMVKITALERYSNRAGLPRATPDVPVAKSPSTE